MLTPRDREAAAAAGARIISIDEENYPPLLRVIPDPPPYLYVRGDPACLLKPQLAVVGSRRASAAGLKLTRLLSEQAAQAGLVITSGLAMGIDGAAHSGALAARGSSIGVMATGIDRLYPARNRSLALELEQAGALVTEFPPGTSPHRYNFPRRNRIISGLSIGVLVVEAALPSGSLITANTALVQGREVFALPWSILHAGGRGCLQLIRDGAVMVQDIQDILTGLAPVYSRQGDWCRDTSGSTGRDSEKQGRRRERSGGLIDLVGYEMVSLDELVQHSANPVSQVLRELSELELSGAVKRVPGGYMRC